MEGCWSRLKQGQSHWVIAFEAGGQLVDQACLAYNQAFLVAREGLEFLDQGTIRPQPPQVSKVTAPGSGPQIGIDSIRFGSCGFAMAVHGLGIHRVDGQAGLQQSSNEQSMAGFDSAC